ncbi:MAG: aminotransferase class V-fold PLP-dependent enzyme [Dehalococcoidia bacterium]
MFAGTTSLDELRARGYSQLDEQGHVYLDYTGGGLYDVAQIRAHAAMLESSVFGNPHSTNPTSELSGRYIEKLRASVLDFFSADPDEYIAIFTANATGAIKLVGEAYPFAPGDRYLLTFDNHNSVNGIREFARTKGAEITYVPVVPPELRLDEAGLLKQLEAESPKGSGNGSGQHKLFAYPAQSNMSGVQHSLEWIDVAHKNGWDVMLDAAAFVPTNRLDLSRYKPDFVPLSFYKMFGYPTGVGALIARREALEKLDRPWFAGGTITISSVQAGQHYLAEGEAAFEEGTPNYATLPAVEIGLDHLREIGLEIIHDRVAALTGWLLQQLTPLRHANGSPLVRIYGPTGTKARGGTIALNFYDPNGKLVDHRAVESLANGFTISLRTGCFCNPGAGEIAHGLTEDELKAAFSDRDRMTFEQFLEALERDGDKSAGSVRVSFGLVSTFDDAYAFTQFARTFLDQPSPRNQGLPV